MNINTQPLYPFEVIAQRRKKMQCNEQINESPLKCIYVRWLALMTAMVVVMMSMIIRRYDIFMHIHIKTKKIRRQNIQIEWSEKYYVKEDFEHRLYTQYY